MDLGLRSRGEAEKLGIHPGVSVIWNPPSTRRLGGNIVGKAMDDRAALAIAIEVARRAVRPRLGYEVWVASTIQEEGGLIGAGGLGREYDLAIAIDIGLVGDIPVQHVAFQSYASDAASPLRKGIPSALICYPTRYSYSPIETVREEDLEATVPLLGEFCGRAMF